MRMKPIGAPYATSRGGPVLTENAAVNIHNTANTATRIRPTTIMSPAPMAKSIEQVGRILNGVS